MGEKKDGLFFLFQALCCHTPRHPHLVPSERRRRRRRTHSVAAAVRAAVALSARGVRRRRLFARGCRLQLRVPVVQAPLDVEVHYVGSVGRGDQWDTVN